MGSIGRIGACVRVPARRRILVVCQGGNCRSVACAFILKYEYGADAIACGWEGNTLQTLTMLAGWAETIIVMQAEFRKHIPMRFRHKVEVLDVGPDRWFNSLHTELIQIIRSRLTNPGKEHTDGKEEAEAEVETEVAP